MQDESDKHPELKADLELIKKQILTIHSEGHYVYHHIHPHWLDAVYLKDEKQWDLSNQALFSVDALTSEQTSNLITRSKQILEDWIQPIDSSYFPEGYRAGGLFIEPFDKFKPSFEKNGILYDFSVLRGAKCSLSGAKYDFSASPTEYIYTFDSDILKPENNGKFTEISIELVENKGLHKILNSIWFRLFYKNDAFADGKSNTVVLEKTGKQSFLSKFSNSETLSWEMINPAKIGLYKKHIGSHEFTHFLSHPKLIGPSNLKSMDRLLTKLLKRYTIESDFKKLLNK